MLRDKFSFKVKPLKFDFKFAIICGLPDGRVFHKYFDSLSDDNILMESLIPIPKMIIYGTQSVYAD